MPKSVTDLLHVYGDGLTIDDQFAILSFHLALEPTMGSVVLEHVHLQKTKATKCQYYQQSKCGCNMGCIIMWSQTVLGQADSWKMHGTIGAWQDEHVVSEFINICLFLNHLEKIFT